MNFDKTNFSLLPYAEKIIKPWGYEIIWIDENKPFMGKILHIEAGKRLSLQYHDNKQECWLLINGRAKAILENSIGELVEIELEKGRGYTCNIGQKHRLIGITDCDIVEASTPEVGTTYRLEDDYNRSNEIK